MRTRTDTDIRSPLPVRPVVRRVESGEWKEASPIGFYFAKLWYYERLYPMIFTVGALRAAVALLKKWK